MQPALLIGSFHSFPHTQLMKITLPMAGTSSNQGVAFTRIRSRLDKPASDMGTGKLRSAQVGGALGT
jgi:hypothetical protein